MSAGYGKTFRLRSPIGCAKQGLIDEPRSHRKSLCLTDEGLARAQAAFEALCGDQAHRLACNDTLRSVT